MVWLQALDHPNILRCTCAFETKYHLVRPQAGVGGAVCVLLLRLIIMKRAARLCAVVPLITRLAPA